MHTSCDIIIFFKLQCSETGLVETKVDRSAAWKCARKMKNGEYDPDVDSVVKKIVSNSKVFF